MFRPDVIDLREFYATPLGQAARRMLRRRIRLLWPALTNLRLLGFGYATPYLRPFRDEVERTLAVMPSAQGVLRWPDTGAGLVTIADEIELPFPDSSLDRVLIVHGLEQTEHPRDLLAEIWRVLTPTGRLLAVVPNRAGLWARAESTPFGQGLAFSPRQLSRILRETQFSPVQTATALYLPPTQRRVIMRTARWWEDAGQRFWPRFAGMLLVEAEKQVYALPSPGRKRVRVKQKEPGLLPAPARVSAFAADTPPAPPGR
jgi:SAM-dependent methyltransferase